MFAKKKIALWLTAMTSISVLLIGCAGGDSSNDISKKYSVEKYSDGTTEFYIVTNPKGGKTLGYVPTSGIKLIEVTERGYTYAFKDLNRNGVVDKWEDWREPIDIRAKALAKEMTKEQIAGLMLFSMHEKEIEKGFTDAQKKYLTEDNLRNVLNAGSNNVEAAVRWSNAMQAYVEQLGKPGTAVIPVNFSTDPRSTAGSDDQYMVKGTEISLWPGNLGLAATFDPHVAFRFGQVSSIEYRKMGIATLLGPQIELATEPRWIRFNGTFGESAKLASDMSRSVIDGIQSTYSKSGKDLGWGEDSLNVMIKHFPGDGPGEGGRESHMNSGKYGVYPGNNFKQHLAPFNAGLALNGKTKMSASVMSSYSISVDKEGNSIMGPRKGSAYNKEKMDLLRKDKNYQGVICTDWGVTRETPNEKFTGMPWGMEGTSVEQKHYEVLLAGSDMFGGNNATAPVLAAYDMWEKDYKAGKNKISAKERFRQSGTALIKFMFNTGLFDNPYLIMEDSKAQIASKDKVNEGYQAQLKSVVMVKNKNNTIDSISVKGDSKNKVVYIPSSIANNFDSIWGPGEKKTGPTIDINVAKKYFKEVITDTPIKDKKGNIIGYRAPDLSKVDLAIVGMRTPVNGTNFTSAGLKEGKFYPLSLQYRTYLADGKHVRKTSLGGDILANGKQENRSYFGKKSMITNEYDLDTFENTVKAVKAAEKKTGKSIPVVVALKSLGPSVISEFEAAADAIVVGFSVSDAALLDIIRGAHEPSALLPMQFPANMDTVEAQFEDVAFDMTPYRDAVGNVYDFAYGLNYKGVIKDKRTQKYTK